MESVFYKYGFNKRFPVTYLFLELFARSVENSDTDNVVDVLEPVLVKLGHKAPFKEEMLIQILEDIDQHRQRMDEIKGGKKSGGKGKRSFGSEFLKWFSALDHEQMILLVAGYDYEKATQLYCDVPITVVDKMIETRMGYEWTVAENNFEAVVYGMGGSFKGGGSADKSFEQPKTQEEEAERKAALKKMGFA